MFLTRELPPDVDDIATWVDAVVDCGFDHIVAADHVLGVDPVGAPEWAASWPHPTDFRSAYTHEDVFHGPFVVFGFLAACCRLDLVSGVLVLPQRQTVLVAKEAAEVDVLTRGGLRLGIGVGWNRIEFEALRVPFERRGQLMEEQIELLRRLWTEPVVDFEGEFHTVRSAGLQMLPVQRPIPLWVGGDAPVVLERIGRVGDGWYCNAREAPGADFAAKVVAIRASATASGRDPDAIGVETRQIVAPGDTGLDEAIALWRRYGVTHLAIDTMNVGRTTMAEHVDALRRAARALGLG